MDKKTKMPLSEMDDKALQFHALVVAYRDAERRCEEANQQTEKADREIQGLEAQIKEMAEAYQVLIRANQEMEAQVKEMAEAYQALKKKNTEMMSMLQKKQEEINRLQKTVTEQPAKEEAQERGRDA